MATPVPSAAPSAAPQSAALANMLNYGRKKTTAHNQQLFLAAIAAGVYIALAFVFYITVTTGDDATGWGITRLVGGLVFSMGLILIVVGGGELFTSSTLLVANRLDHSSSTANTLRCWAMIYAGNMLGATFCAALVYLAGLHHLDHGLWGDNLLRIGLHKLHHTPLQAVALGTLCNMLVCLGIWMTFAAKDILTKALLLILPVAMFVSSGFEHSIANLFLLPAAWLVKSLAASELPAQTQMLPLGDITLSQILIANLLPVTLGNIIGGGVLVGGYHWLAYHKSLTQAEFNPATEHTQHSYQEQYQEQHQEQTSMTQIPNALEPIHKIAQPLSLTLSPETSILQASRALRQASSQTCFVLDAKQRLLGTLNQADLFGAWLHDPQATDRMSIAPLVKPVLISAELGDNLSQLKRKLSKAMQEQPCVTDSGILTRYSDAIKPSYSRYKPAPELIPVMNGNKLVAAISCDALLDEYLGELPAA